MRHVRAVLSQCGVAMELHGHTPEPITLTLIRPAELEAYKAELAESNPDYHHAVLSQLAVMYANRIFQNVTVSQSAWTYNASSNEYTRES